LSEQCAIALEKIGFTEPTEIQGKAIPLALSGRDVMASAQTGSGKTAAFALPIIACLDAPGNKPRALVLVPTRELALQVEGQFGRFARNNRLRTVTLYGGTGYGQQMKALKRGVDIIVATPGRLFDFVERHCLDLSKIEILVLDEADRLMDMGFMPQVRRVLKRVPRERQTLMFSATIDERIERIAAEFLDNPVAVRANGKQIEPTEINQHIHHVNEFAKDALLVQLIREQNMSSVLVFTNTRRKATWVKDRLRDSNVIAEDIHGDLSQSQRERTLRAYRAGAFPVLVATDVAARGLDVPTISHVINYDLPESAQSYIHRIGRTGRAGRAGVAISFVGEGQQYLVRDIEKAIGRVLDPNAVRPRAATKAVRRFRPRSRARRRSG
jgi:ATP-dependent RNA helicase RhlE